MRDRLRISDLYEIRNEKREKEKLIRLYMGAFGDYPKLKGLFKEERAFDAALEALLRFYVDYDLTYGKAFSLDENMDEAVCIMEFEAVQGYSDRRCKDAGCFSEEYLSAMSRLTDEEQRQWKETMEEIDRQEKRLTFPEPYFYVDFVAVKKGLQGEGHGSALMKKLTDNSDRENMPIMLFTNTEDDIRFYEKLGFRKVAVTRSEKYRFENTYMFYMPRPIRK